MVNINTVIASGCDYVVCTETELSTDGGSRIINFRQLCSVAIKLPGNTCTSSPQIITTNMQDLLQVVGHGTHV